MSAPQRPKVVRQNTTRTCITNTRLRRRTSTLRSSRSSASWSTSSTSTPMSKPCRKKMPATTPHSLTNSSRSNRASALPPTPSSCFPSHAPKASQRAFWATCRNRAKAGVLAREFQLTSTTFQTIGRCQASQTTRGRCQTWHRLRKRRSNHRRTFWLRARALLQVQPLRISTRLELNSLEFNNVWSK